MENLDLSQFNENLAAELALEEHDQESYGLPLPSGVSKARPFSFYRVMRAPEKSEKWKHIGEGNFFTEEGEEFNSLFMTPLFLAPYRDMSFFKDGKMERKCGSFDAVNPAFRFAEPPCRKLGAADVAQVLAVYKMPEAKIAEVVKELVPDEVDLDGKRTPGILTQCAYVDERGRRWPLCPAATGYIHSDGKLVKDEGKPMKKPRTCKPQTALFAYDHERKRAFRIEIPESETEFRSDYTSPILQLIEVSRTKKIPLFYFRALMKAVKNPKGFYVLGFEDIGLIEDAEQRQHFAAKKQEAQELMLNSQMWVPPQKEEKAAG